MKKFVIITGLIISTLTSAQSLVSSVEVNVPITNIYIPPGFDNNDMVEIIVEGYLPNLCYFYPKAGVSSKTGNNIVVEVKANLVKGKCGNTKVPFTSTLKFDFLTANIYKIAAKGYVDFKTHNLKPSPVRLLKVALSKTPYKDTAVYANVTSVHSKDFDTIVIQGYHPGSCFELGDIDIDSTAPGVIVILSKALRIPLSDCSARTMQFFQQEIEIPTHPFIKDQKRALIHVRSMSGKSLNYVHYFSDSF